MSRIWLISLALLVTRCGGNGAALDCGQNLVCNPQCQAGEDPDCGKQGCAQDGTCNDKCPTKPKITDPDCDCSADKNCNAACASGTDPDCAPAAAGQNVWPGFNGAAGTMRGKNYQVSGALVPADYGTTAAGKSHQVDTGIRR